MRNMKEKFVRGIKDKAVRSMGSVARKSGEISMETSCQLYTYEPRIPNELLVQMKSE